MKTNRNLLILMIPALFLITSCNKDDGYSLGKTWRGIATVENPDNESYFFFLLDNGTRMWTAATTNSYYRPADGQRIIADFNILSDGPGSGSYNHDVRLVSAYTILTKGIFNVTEETQDSIGYDKVKIEDIWVGSNYLNIRFGYNGSNKAHFINLVSDASKTYTDDKIHLEFRHNANNDAPLYGIRGIVSFDLRSLQKEEVDSLPLVIHANEFDESEEKTYELTYKFTGLSDVEESYTLEELNGDIL